MSSYRGIEWLLHIPCMSRLVQFFNYSPTELLHKEIYETFDLGHLDSWA
jgi:hypothetical protein